MNPLFVATLVALAAVSCAAPSGHGGAIVAGPAGIVTDHGPIGPAGHGVGLGWGAGLGHGVGLGWGAGLGHGAIVAAPAVAAVAPVAVGVGLGHGLALGHGVGAVTNGGGTIGVSSHGAAIRGPGTAPVVVAGPSGKIAADGLWGPTANIGLTGHGAWAGHGAGWIGAGHGGWGHGW